MFTDAIYNQIEARLLEESDPEIMCEDNSFDYEYGSQRGVYRDIATYIPAEEFSFVRNVSHRVLVPVLQSMTENITLEKWVGDDLLHGWMDFRVHALTYEVVLNWRKVRS